MNLIDTLKKLAHGIHPETGKKISKESIASSPEAIRILFGLSDELRELKIENQLANSQKRYENTTNGKPARSGFSWDNEEKNKLLEAFTLKEDIAILAKNFERSELAIASQLKSQGLLSEQEYNDLRERK